jgi:hypothetical protein
MIQNFVRLGKAPKLNGRGFISYRVWVDKAAKQYIQLSSNTQTGTFSEILFSVQHYASVCHTSRSIGFPKGYSFDCDGLIESKNNNDGAFIKAALRHLLH